MHVGALRNASAGGLKLASGACVDPFALKGFCLLSHLTQPPECPEIVAVEKAESHAIPCLRLPAPTLTQFNSTHNQQTSLAANAR